jgi:hypothetical protein
MTFTGRTILPLRLGALDIIVSFSFDFGADDDDDPTDSDSMPSILLLLLLLPLLVEAMSCINDVTT